jgi:hypothetical protein
MSQAIKTKPEFEFRELKESDTDGVTFRKSTREIVLWHVWSSICDQWFEIPLDIIAKTFPYKLEMAQAEIDQIPHSRGESA